MNTDHRIPGGPLGLPLLNFVRSDPLRAAATFQRQFGDVAKLEVLYRKIYYFFDPEAVRAILVDHHEDFVREARLLKIFASFQGQNVLTSEGADWARQRRILAPGFSPKRVAGYMQLMRSALVDSIAEELPAALGQCRVIDADALTTRITMDVILRTLFSAPTTEAEARSLSVAIRALSQQSMQEVYWAFVPPNWLPYPGRRQKLKHMQTLRSLIDRHIQARRVASEQESDRHDVLSMMLSAQDAESGQGSARLSDQEIHDNCFLLFAAGFDTASSAMTWWLGLMASHPDVADRVRAEVASIEAGESALEQIARLPLLNATIKEAMRLYPPSTALFTRVAMRDVQIGATLVRKGTLAVIPIWQLHHDARSFANPELFQPERFLPGANPIPRSAFLPFGAGPHFCLGQHFAYVEMALIAASLISCFDVAWPEGAGLPEPTVDVALKPKTPMQLCLTRRRLSVPG